MRHTYNEDVTNAREDSHNIHYVNFIVFPKQLLSQTSHWKTIQNFRRCYILYFAWKQAFEIELMLFDVIAYKQIHPHYLWVSAFHDKLNS